ncbi:TRAM domain-containing protein [archaeon]|jgi:predicted RNA-binding protein with TRAM domain|nr:TRAM domain-containing protein [archaeon]MBT6762175.1 TRAM domain-containing protein [archaeon]
MNIPVVEGKEYDVSIQAVGGKGDGIARVQGFVVFVPGVKKGDYVKIRVKKVLEKAAFGELVEKLVKPVRKSKFTEVNVAEERYEPRIPDKKYDDSEDFGEDIEDEDDF